MLKSLERFEEQQSKPEYLKFYNGQRLWIMGRGFAIAIVQGGTLSKAKLKGENTQ